VVVLGRFAGGAVANFIEATYTNTASVTESGDYRTIVWTGSGAFTLPLFMVKLELVDQNQNHIWMLR